VRLLKYPEMVIWDANPANFYQEFHGLDALPQWLHAALRSLMFCNNKKWLGSNPDLLG
jgi:hypothetical protein